MTSTTTPTMGRGHGIDLARLVEASPDILFQITPDARWCFLNPAWMAILGYPVASSLGQPMAAFAVPPDDGAVEAAVTEVLRRGAEVTDRRLRWRGADGAILWLQLQCRRLTDDQGRTVGAVGTLRDVTAAAEDADALAREHALNLAMLKTAEAPILVLEADGLICRFNPACERLSGYAAAEVIGHNIFDLLVPVEDRADLDDAFERTLAQGAMQHENRWVHRNGGSRLILWSNSRLDGLDGGKTLIISIGTDITQQRAVEQALRDSERRLREIADLLTEGVYVVDAEDRVTFLNPAASKALGWSQDEAAGLNSHQTWHSDYPDGTPYVQEDCPVHRCLSEGIVVRSHKDWFRTREGNWLPVAMTAAPIIRHGTVTGAVVAFHDISERLDAQSRLRESEARYRTLFNGSNDAIFVVSLNDTNRADRIVEVNRVACDRLGYSRQDLLGRTVAEITDPGSMADAEEVMRRLIQDGSTTFERVHITRDGRKVPVEINASLVDYDGRRVMISVARDVTERKEAEERIRYLADFDHLTGLPNRAQFTRRCDQELARAGRHGHHMALLFLDLDGFKAVNDTHGHVTGDALLKVVAARLTGSLRISDVAARQGGDEFVILLPEADGAATAERVADKLIEEINQPILVDGLSLRVGASIGIAISPHDGETSSDLLRHADAAMYAAKAAGRNQWARFHAAMEPVRAG